MVKKRNRKPLSEATKQKISSAMKGRKLSAEERAKRSEGQRRAWRLRMRKSSDPN